MSSTVTEPRTAQLRTALDAAKAAGDVLRNGRTHPPEVDQVFAHDIKLAADRNAEQAILQIIREQDATAEIHTEEAGDFDGTSDSIWYIDPLDGTMNYYHGQHHYCTCVGVYQREPDPTGLGRPLAGVVLAPDHDEVFMVQAGSTATCNDVHLNCSPVSQLKDAIVGTSFGSRKGTMTTMSQLFAELLPATRKLRILGSCGLDICQVAAGRLSALYQRDIRVWDFAAAALMVQQAGGRVEIQPGDRPDTWHILASAPGCYQELRSRIHECTPPGETFELTSEGWRSGRT